MEDHLTFVEHDVTFHLEVELLSNISTGNGLWQWPGPFTANGAGVHDIGNQLQCVRWDTAVFEAVLHLCCGSMPPSKVELL